MVPGTTCFVCDRVLTPTNGTMEHVVPRWVLSRYGLWATTYTLSAGRSLTDMTGSRLVRAMAATHASDVRSRSRCASAVVDGAELDLDVARLWLAELNCGFDAADAANSEVRSHRGEQAWSQNEREHRSSSGSSGCSLNTPEQTRSPFGR